MAGTTTTFNRTSTDALGQPTPRPHRRRVTLSPMRFHRQLHLLLLLLFTAACGGDELGDNPVLGSEGPGAIADPDTTNYGLLVVLAICLIAAGAILVKLEAWQRRNHPDDD